MQAGQGSPISAAEVEQSIHQAIREVLDIGDRELTHATTFEDLGLSSLHVASVTFALEERWSIEIPTERLAEFKSVATTRDAVLELWAKAQTR